MVGGRVEGRRRGRASLSGVVEAVLSARGPGVTALGTQTQGATEETESGADPAGVQREAEGHQTLGLVDADREPDCRHDATNSWRTQEEKS